MAANLLDTAKGLLTSGVIDKTAEHIGESPERTRSAMNGAIPTVFAALTGAASTEGGATRLFGALTEATGGGALGKLASVTGFDVRAMGGRGEGLANKVLGDRAGAVSSLISQSSGIKGPGGSHILSMAFALVTGIVGKEMVGNRLGAGGLAQLLFGQKKAILDDPDTPKGLAGALGIGGLSELGGPAAEIPGPHVSSTRMAPPVPDITRRAPEPVRARPVPAKVPDPKRWGILGSALLLGALAIAAFYVFFRNRAPTMNTADRLPAVPTMRLPEVPLVPEMPTVQPPSLTGAHITVPEKVEAPTPASDLAGYMANNSHTLPHTFDLEGLKFDFGAATLQPGANASITEVAAALAAHPTARIRIEGYTDNVGDSAVNQSLSSSRADTVKQALIAQGVATDRIETAGFGDAKPIAENTTEEGRAKNRRTEVVLLSR